MTILLATLLVLLSPAVLAEEKTGKLIDLTIRRKPLRESMNRNAELIVKLRNRLSVIESKNSQAKHQDDADAIKKSLDAADAALISQAPDGDVSRVPTRAEATPNATGRAPKDVPAESRPSPRPDPKTIPNECSSIACKASEGLAKGGLGSLRAGSSIFYGDTEGTFPENLSKLVPKYVDAIPAIEVGGHAKTNAVRVVTKADGKSPGAYVEDTGGWLYFRTADNSALDGQVIIDCNHADYKGRPLWGF